jgi:hypothetical protein
MDPYLEGDLWSSVHASLSVEIARQLSPKLRPRYVALIQKRFVADMPQPAEEIEISPAEAVLFPDVGVANGGKGRGSGSGTLAKSPLQLRTVMPELVPVHWVEVRDVAERLLVTAIEVLSPVNKRGEGRREYLKRRRKLLLSSAHLIEIDLLRLGRRVPMMEPLPAAPYFAFLSRVEKRPLTEVWPIHLDSELPTIPVPLLPGDKDTALDLQAAMKEIYSAFGYDIIVDYSKPPEVPLTTKEQAWARERIANADAR